jgi:hypothetical protein
MSSTLLSEIKWSYINASSTTVSSLDDIPSYIIEVIVVAEYENCCLVADKSANGVRLKIIPTRPVGTLIKARVATTTNKKGITGDLKFIEDIVDPKKEKLGNESSTFQIAGRPFCLVVPPNYKFNIDANGEYKLEGTTPVLILQNVNSSEFMEFKFSFSDLKNKTKEVSVFNLLSNTLINLMQKDCKCYTLGELEAISNWIFLTPGTGILWDNSCDWVPQLLKERMQQIANTEIENRYCYDGILQTGEHRWTFPSGAMDHLSTPPEELNNEGVGGGVQVLENELACVMRETKEVLNIRTNFQNQMKVIGSTDLNSVASGFLNKAAVSCSRSVVCNTKVLIMQQQFMEDAQPRIVPKVLPTSEYIHNSFIQLRRVGLEMQPYQRFHHLASTTCNKEEWLLMSNGVIDTSEASNLNAEWNLLFQQKSGDGDWERVSSNGKKDVNKQNKGRFRERASGRGNGNAKTAW